MQAGGTFFGRYTVIPNQGETTLFHFKFIDDTVQTYYGHMYKTVPGGYMDVEGHAPFFNIASKL